MKWRFTKMQGAGNDFVVLDATREALELTPERLRFLGDRRFGVGADQILVVGASPAPGVDFSYRIFNNTGDEVEQCGNGARCFVRYVHDKGLTSKPVVRVQTVNSLIELRLQPDGRVEVDMNRPIFEPSRVPFDASGLLPRMVGNGSGSGADDGSEPFALWPLDVGDTAVEVAVLSMGNPHAVQRVDDVEAAPVATVGPRVELHERFPRRVNAGFMQVVSRSHIKLRVHERDAGETLACGTGACAAVVAGIRLGWLDAVVDVDTRGGRLTIEWQGGDAPVLMTGPAVSVFEGEIEVA